MNADPHPCQQKHHRGMPALPQQMSAARPGQQAGSNTGTPTKPVLWIWIRMDPELF